MAIGSVNYASAITVNGYSCRNCAEVDLAAKGIDPQHPKSGPFDINAASDPSRQATDPAKIAAAKHAADRAKLHVTGYSRAGAQMGGIEPGSGYSLIA